jgi:pimeloyl-ACP methyl ester carboxylesterase
VPGTIALHVERVHSGDASRPPIFAEAGGPGEPATASTLDYAALLGPALKTRDLIVFDQRGTGRSGLLRCAGIERGDDPASALPDCAAQLGEAAHHYTTADSADDLDALRAELGAPRASLFGTSYGTWLAQVWARRHPASVESLVLDSTVSQTQIEDGFERRVFEELPRAFGAFCAPDACRGLTRDLWDDGVKLYDRLLRKPLEARWYDGAGKPHTMMIGAVPFALLAVESDVHAEQRAELPRAIAAALKGDGRLLARMLVNDALAGERPARAQSETLNRVTQCEEKDFEFDRSGDPQQRLEQARAALTGIPDSAFAPFGRGLAFLNSLVPVCAYWPSLPQRPDFGGSLPEVPALMLHGEHDLRTTLGDTTEVAAQLPNAVVLRVPQTGHSTWATDVTGCVRRAIRLFLSGAAPGACEPTSSTPYAPRALPPRFARGRAVADVGETVADGFSQLDDVARRDAAARNRARIGGLNGGSLRGGAGGPTFERYEYVRGLAVSGRVPKTGVAVMRITGKLSGTLRFGPGGRVSGRLGGRRVRARARLVRETPYEALRRRGLVPG